MLKSFQITHDTEELSWAYGLPVRARRQAHHSE